MMSENVFMQDFDIGKPLKTSNKDEKIQREAMKYPRL